MSSPGFNAETFTRDHVLFRNTYLVTTNLGDVLALDYDRSSHYIDPKVRLSFPPIEELRAGAIIRVTYTKPLVNDPLVDSQAPEMKSAVVVGQTPAYEVVVKTYALNQEELNNSAYITTRIQEAVKGQGTVVGIR